MNKDILDIVISQGVFATLFIWILFDTRKENKIRENKYQDVINSLADRLGEMKDIKDGILQIRNKLLENKN